MKKAIATMERVTTTLTIEKTITTMEKVIS